MEFVNILRKEWYDSKLQRFQSIALYKRDGIISVFSRECSESISCSIYRHIGKFYNSLDTEPYICWIFEQSVLPNHFSFKQTPSTTGDNLCHYDVAVITRRDAQNLVKRIPEMIDECFVCVNELLEPLRSHMDIFNIIQ